eukprot:SAG11_NODE_2344_length_3487_cov_28.493506_4_plen_105_part_00
MCMHRFAKISEVDRRASGCDTPNTAGTNTVDYRALHRAFVLAHGGSAHGDDCTFCSSVLRLQIRTRVLSSSPFLRVSSLLLLRSGLLQYSTLLCASAAFVSTKI